MNSESIEIQIIHIPHLNEDNGFGIRVLIDNKEVLPIELKQEDMLHIGAILLNASRKFINNADKVK